MRVAAVLFAIAALVGAGIWGVLSAFGHFRTVSHEFAGACTPVTGVAGPEDIRIDPKRRRAFLSSLDRRNEAARGAIHVFDIDDPLAAGGWRDMTDGTPAAFRPLGLDYFEDGEVARLFVVNEATRAVELFDVAADGALTHLETFAERRLTSPNDVVAIGPRSFYVTNDVRSGRDSLIGRFQFLTRAAAGAVFLHDGVSWREAAAGLRFPNGLAVSADGATLYVAETTGGAVRAFDRDPETGGLAHSRTIALPAAPDNLSLDEDGALWVASHPKPLAVPLHEARAETPAPSMVVRIDATSGAAQTVYADDGSEISASSAAAHMGRTLMIGALYENKFLLCELPDGEF